MRWGQQFSLLLALEMFGVGGQAQQTGKTRQHEQSGFSVEQEIVPVEKPTILPRGALQVLAKEAGVASCLENENVSSDQLPPSWFVGSEIHLNGPDEADLVVLPNLATGTHDGPGPAACFLGANTGQFWILRKTRDGYRLVLSVFTHSLTVLNSKWKGYRSIEAITISLATNTRTFFRFDGKEYKLYMEKTQPNR
jgi:hypothetical protein